MKFDSQYFEKNPVEFFDPKTKRQIGAKFTQLFSTYSLKNEPAINVEQAHEMLRNTKEFSRRPLHQRAEVAQVLANHHADRRGIARPTLRIVHWPLVPKVLFPGMANGNSIYLRSHTLGNAKAVSNYPIHETEHLHQDSQGIISRTKNGSLYLNQPREVSARKSALDYQKEFDLPGVEEFEKIEKIQSKVALGKKMEIDYTELAKAKELDKNTQPILPKDSVIQHLTQIRQSSANAAVAPNRGIDFENLSRLR